MLAPSADGAPPVFADGRDPYTLLDRHLVNRELFSQLSAQPYRLFARSESYAAAADAAIGTQQTVDAPSQSRFHGYFLADTYAAVRIVEGLDANLNVLFLNPSASDGYRASSMVMPGFALHARYPLVSIAGDFTRLDLVGTDLGWVTLGQGLLLEQTPLEGVMGAISWRDASLRYMYAGRALWPDDDLITLSLDLFGRKVTLTGVEWHKKEDAPAARVQTSPPQSSVHYLSGSTGLPLGAGFRVAAEYAARIDASIHDAWMARADYLSRDLAFLSVHTGCQVRRYAQHFGPRDRYTAPTWIFNTPYQQDVYLTNPFEYYLLTPSFDQWSYTLMLEARLRPVPFVELLLDAEERLRVADAGPGIISTVQTPDGFGVPGRKVDALYRIGVNVYPWVGGPHRVSAFVTNKQVRSDLSPSLPVTQRFQPGTYYVLSLEAFL